MILISPYGGTTLWETPHLNSIDTKIRNIDDNKTLIERRLEWY